VPNPDPNPPPGFGLSIAPANFAGSAPASVSPRPPVRAAVPSIADLAAGVLRADRAALGRALSLVESTSPAHEQPAQDLLHRLLPHTGNARRIGITGVPGAGKSTLIERLGCDLLALGRRIAVLAVDPSSRVSGGSILGDKTRMARLATDPRAFIRPSPSGGALGGVTNATRQAILVCEAAGFDTILVETVGVGQSETAVADMTDFFLAVMVPSAGDELQGIKRGLLELVDLIAVNKADGDNLPRARLAAADYQSAVHIASARPPDDHVPVITCSALTGSGLQELWSLVSARLDRLDRDGRLAQRRRDQALRWLDELLAQRLTRLLHDSPAAAAALADARLAVHAGTLNPVAAAARVTSAWLASVASQNR
jgi:LAO/AO transport system kinase